MQSAKMADFKPFDATNWKIGVVVSQFNQDISEALCGSLLARAQEYNLQPNNISVFRVAGCVEVPLVLQQLAISKQYDVLIALGCVIKGDTPHFDYVCKFVTEGVLRVQLDQNIPIGFGILTCNNYKEATARRELGRQFLDAAMQQASTIRSIQSV